MKKTYSKAFCILALSSLLLLATAGIANAYLSAYSYGEYSGVTITFDGKWTASSEWSAFPWMDLSASARFSGCVDMTAGTYQYNIIDFMTDTTNDAGDYWQICMHDAGEAPNAPSSDSYKIEYRGHTTLVVFQGNGTGWTQLATPPAGFAIQNAFGASPLSSTPHWTCEIQINKEASPIDTIPPIGIRVAAYDASNAVAGVQAWPPLTVSSPDNPSQWGSISGYVGEIPEGLGIGVVVLLTAVAAVGAFGLRKRSRAANLAKIV